MRAEEQFLTIEQTKHLQKLGLDMSDATFYWCKQYYDRYGNAVPKDTFKLTFDRFEYEQCIMSDRIPTYTLQEILDKLPKTIYTKLLGRCEVNITGKLIRYASDSKGIGIEGSYFHCNELLTSAYKLLMWVLKHKESLIFNKPKNIKPFK